jgi:hypothetical protein
MSLRRQVRESLVRRSLTEPLLEICDRRRSGEEVDPALLRRVHAGLDAIAKEHPVLTLARGIGELHRGFREEGERFGTRRSHTSLARRLYDSIGALWVPDLDEERLVRALYDDATLTRLAAEHAPMLQDHPELGVAPVSGATLARLVARAFLPVSRELNVRVTAARDAVLARDGDERRWELASALETLFGAQEISTGAYPPLRVRLALRPFLCELPVIQTYSREFLPDGSSHEVATPFRHQVLGVALVQLQSAFEALIPGVLSLMSGTPSRADEVEILGRSGRGTNLFREEAGVGEGPASLGDRLLLMMERPLFHASMIGTLSVWEREAQSKVSVVDRLIPIRHSAREDVEAGLHARIVWHRKALTDLSMSAPILHAVGPPLEVVRHALLQEILTATRQLECIFVFDLHGKLVPVIPSLPRLDAALQALRRFQAGEAVNDPVQVLLRAGYAVSPAAHRKAGRAPIVAGREALIAAVAQLAAAWSQGPNPLLSANAWIERELARRLG